MISRAITPDTPTISNSEDIAHVTDGNGQNGAVPEPPLSYKFPTGFYALMVFEYSFYDLMVYLMFFTTLAL
jgi:hypothetical protein